MPIEIRELVIRAVVEPAAGEREAAAPARDDDERARLIQDCVAEVMRQLRRQRER